MKIEYSGQVRQRTGEDWIGTKLILSTVPPTSGLQLPELDPWHISPFVIPMQTQSIKRTKFAGRPALLRGRF